MLIISIVGTFVKTLPKTWLLVLRSPILSIRSVSIAEGPNGSLGAIGYTDLAIDVAEVGLQSVPTHHKLLRDVLGVTAHG